MRDTTMEITIDNYIIKGKLGQFPVEEILNKEDRIVRGWVSVEAVDKQGEIVPISEFRKTLNTWMKRGGTINDQHSNRQIGKALRWFEKEHPDNASPGIMIDYQIYKDYTVDDDVWKEICNGTRKGLSFGGRATGDSTIKEDAETGGYAKQLSGVEAYEVSSVTEPANQHAMNVAVNFMAKGMSGVDKDKELMSDLQKGFNGDVNKPYGGFANQKMCVSAQLKKGHTLESAERVCNFLEHKLGMEEKPMNPLLQTGIDIETKEHPSVSPEEIKQLVQDHLSEDPNYYDEYKKSSNQYVRDKTGPHGIGEGPGNGLATCKSELFKGRIYLKPGQKPPKGAKMQRGAKGGMYYEDPGKEPAEESEVPETAPGKHAMPGDFDPQGRRNKPDNSNTPPEEADAEGELNEGEPKQEGGGNDAGRNPEDYPQEVWNRAAGMTVSDADEFLDEYDRNEESENQENKPSFTENLDRDLEQGKQDLHNEWSGKVNEAMSSDPNRPKSEVMREVNRITEEYEKKEDDHVMSMASKAAKKMGMDSKKVGKTRKEHDAFIEGAKLILGSRTNKSMSTMDNIKGNLVKAWRFVKCLKLKKNYEEINKVVTGIRDMKRSRKIDKIADKFTEIRKGVVAIKKKMPIEKKAFLKVEKNYEDILKACKKLKENRKS